MKKRILKAFCAVTALTMLLSGCNQDVINEITGGSSGAGNGGWGDAWGGTTTTEKTTAPSVTDSGNAGGTESGNSGGTTVDTNDRTRFEESGTLMSVINGDLEIQRLSREQEKDMGGDDWTILVYLCGTDLESEVAMGSSDILEAIEADYSDKVNFVFQTGGTKKWHDSDIRNDKLQRFVVNEYNFTKVDEQPIASMGEASTLADFIEWGVKEYPADNVGLVFWNHGGGSISGVCFDELYSNDSLTLTEIDSALNDSFDVMTEKFEFIGFDACIMSTLETANILVPYAKYMYASEEYEPGYGWDYTAVLNAIVRDPDINGKELGKAVADSYYEHCRMSDSEAISTFSITDLSKIDALLLSFNETAKQMYESDDFIEIVKGILEVDNFGGNNRNEGYTNMVDLGGILEAVSRYCPNAKDTLQKLDSAVVYKKNGYLHLNAGGLAVYFPLAVQGTVELSVFADICSSTYYLAFVDKIAYGTTGNDVDTYDNDTLTSDYANIWDIDYDYGDYTTNTDDFADYDDTGCTIPVEDIYFDADGYYTVELDNFDNLHYAACSVFLQDYDGSYVYLGCDDEIYYDYSNNLITDNFDGSWLSLGDGQPLPIEIVFKNDDYSIYTCSILLNGEYTNLRLEYDWDNSQWNVAGTWDGVDFNTGMVGREVRPLEYGDVITPVYFYLTDTTTDYFTGYDYTYNGSLGLEYMMLPAADYDYSITLYDIYGNWYFTPEVTFTVEEDGSLSFYPEDLENLDGDSTTTGGSGSTGTTGGEEDYSEYFDNEYYDEFILCEECNGEGCHFCGYYGYLLYGECEECNGYGGDCYNCGGYGYFMAVACEYCHGLAESCWNCDQYY